MEASFWLTSLTVDERIFAATSGFLVALMGINDVRVFLVAFTGHK